MAEEGKGPLVCDYMGKYKLKPNGKKNAKSHCPPLPTVVDCHQACEVHEGKQGTPVHRPESDPHKHTQLTCDKGSLPTAGEGTAAPTRGALERVVCGQIAKGNHKTTLDLNLTPYLKKSKNRSWT